jgi:hypothetical protein
MIFRLLLLIGTVALLGAAEPVPQPKALDPLEAAKAGRELAAKLLSQEPSRSVTNVGVLKTRDAQGKRTELPVTFRIIVTSTNWWTVYETAKSSVRIARSNGRANEYHFEPEPGKHVVLRGNETMVPLAGSDFWIADLGLEFLHWPEQRLLRKEIRRGQSCDVLESISPHPAPGAYSRVVAWIDIDSGGILNAEAYDSRGKLLKEFATRSVAKVECEWQLEEMEIGNRQDRSRTWIEFSFDRK